MSAVAGYSLYQQPREYDLFAAAYRHPAYTTDPLPPGHQTWGSSRVSRHRWAHRRARTPPAGWPSTKGHSPIVSSQPPCREAVDSRAAPTWRPVSPRVCPYERLPSSRLRPRLRAISSRPGSTSAARQRYGPADALRSVLAALGSGTLQMRGGDPRAFVWHSCRGSTDARRR
jgi:hypothetical protein